MLTKKDIKKFWKYVENTFEKDEIQMVTYIYLIDLNYLKLMVDLYYRQEAEEGIGVYMHKMTTTIKE